MKTILDFRNRMKTSLLKKMVFSRYRLSLLKVIPFFVVCTLFVTPQKSFCMERKKPKSKMSKIGRAMGWGAMFYKDPRSGYSLKEDVFEEEEKLSAKKAEGASYYRAYMKKGSRFLADVAERLNTLPSKMLTTYGIFAHLLGHGLAKELSGILTWEFCVEREDSNLFDKKCLYMSTDEGPAQYWTHVEREGLDSEQCKLDLCPKESLMKFNNKEILSFFAEKGGQAIVHIVESCMSNDSENQDVLLVKKLDIAIKLLYALVLITGVNLIIHVGKAVAPAVKKVFRERRYPVRRTFFRYGGSSMEGDTLSGSSLDSGVEMGTDTVDGDDTEIYEFDTSGSSGAIENESSEV